MNVEKYLKRCKEMLNIRKIKLGGFKNINNVELEFDKITSLISVNNYGKSNLLQAIDFGIDFISASPREKESRMSWRAGIPLIKEIVGKNFNFIIEFEFVKGEYAYLVEYSYCFQWKSSRDVGPQIISENLKIRNQAESQKYTLFIDRSIDDGKIKISRSGRCDKEVKIGRFELIINKLQSLDDLYYLDIVEAINDLTIYIDRHFDSENLYETSPIIRKNTNNLSPFSDNDIARTLFFLKKEHKKKYELIINTLMDFFPYIEKVTIKEINLTEKNINANIPEDAPFELSDYMYLLFVTNKNLAKTMSYSSMSDGAKRILSILTYVTLAELNNIPLIAIEEPENSIHPKFLKKYVNVLKNFSEKSKIILTSHSPYLINYVSISSLYLGVVNPFGIARFEKIKPSSYLKINNYSYEMGVQVGEYLFDLMSSEDEMDIEMLRKYVDYE